MKKIIFILFLLLSVYSISGQADTVAQLRVISGGSVYFHFNSLSKISTGIEYQNWTSLRIYFVATNNSSAYTAAQWKLSVRTRTSGTISGDGGTNFLNTETVQIRAFYNATWSSWISLTNADQILVNNGTNPANYATVEIEYRCGMDTSYSILGKSSDYYYKDLLFTLDLI